MRSLPIALVTAALLSAAAADSVQAPPAPGERFLTSLVGEWVGTAQQFIDDEAPATRYFHLVVRRRDPRTFETRIRYYRTHPETGALEQAGQERGTSTMEPDGTVRRQFEGTGTVLVNFRPKPETHSAIGQARPTAAGGLEGDATGTIQVAGLPFGLGRRGKIERAREEWNVRSGVLTGRTSIVARFRALLVTRRFRVETVCRGERGSDVVALAARKGARRASLR
jgi:hypothetical protein